MDNSMHKVEGVSFNKNNVSAMKKKAFVDDHVNVFFLDLPEEKRREILSDIYDKIKGVSSKVKD